MKDLFIKTALYDPKKIVFSNIKKIENFEKICLYDDFEELFFIHRSKKFDIIYIVLEKDEKFDKLELFINDLDNKTLLFMILDEIIINTLNYSIKTRVDSFVILENIINRENKILELLEKINSSLKEKRKDNDFLYNEMENRKNSENKLMILSKLLEEIPLGVVIVDLDGNIEYTNAHYLNINGYEYEELIGQKWWTIGIEDKMKKIFNILLKGKVWSGTFLSRRKNCDIFWENASYYSIKDYEGNQINYIGISEDVTLKMELQKEIIESKNKAEMGAKAKSSFLANMSHEIRTPLSAVIMLSDMLSESKLNDEDMKMVKLLKNSADSLLSIINDVLDFSKLESEKLNLENQEFDILEFLVENIDVFKVMAEDKKIKINLKIDENIPNILKGDNKRLRQVLNNIVGNAIKFTKEGMVSLKVKILEEMERNIFLEFKVIDTGIGISKDGINHIFEEFYQVESSYTKKIKGTGLGLVIARKLVRMMGGDISVESKEGEGSVFSFDIRFEKV